MTQLKSAEPPLGSATDSAAEKISDHGRGRSVNLKPSKHKKQRNATDVHCSHLHTISYNYLYGNCDSVHIWSYTLRQAIIDWVEVLSSKLLPCIGAKVGEALTSKPCCNMSFTVWHLTGAHGGHHTTTQIESTHHTPGAGTNRLSTNLFWCGTRARWLSWIQQCPSRASWSQ